MKLSLPSSLVAFLFEVLRVFPESRSKQRSPAIGWEKDSLIKSCRFRLPCCSFSRDRWLANEQPRLRFACPRFYYWFPLKINLRFYRIHFARVVLSLGCSSARRCAMESFGMKGNNDNFPLRSRHVLAGNHDEGMAGRGRVAAGFFLNRRTFSSSQDE